MKAVNLSPNSREKINPGAAQVNTTKSTEIQREQPTSNERKSNQKCLEKGSSTSISLVNQNRSQRESISKEDEEISSTIEPQCSDEAEMRGFKAFLIAIKAFDVAFMIGVVLFVYLIESVAFYPFTVFCVIEIMTLIVSIVHARQPVLGVVVIYVTLEVGKALAAMTLALVTVLNDHDKDCAVTQCKTFNFSPVERFRFFWFLVSKAALSMFLCLVVMAHSPQLHDYNAEDDTTPLNF